MKKIIALLMVAAMSTAVLTAQQKARQAALIQKQPRAQLPTGLILKTRVRWLLVLHILNQ